MSPKSVVIQGWMVQELEDYKDASDKSAVVMRVGWTGTGWSRLDAAVPKFGGPSSTPSAVPTASASRPSTGRSWDPSPHSAWLAIHSGLRLPVRGTSTAGKPLLPVCTKFWLTAAPGAFAAHT